MIDFTSNLRILLRKFEKVNQLYFICFVSCSHAAAAAADDDDDDDVQTLNEKL